MKRKSVILIAGPTASGKTPLAIELAKKFHTDIISADSRQCFRELNIGVAKPSPAELASVKHYFINSHSIQQPVTAAAFEKEALLAAEEIFRENDIAVMAGGTGLYIRAFCEGLDQIPPVPGNIRQTIIAGYEANGLDWLQQQVTEHDPLFMQHGEMTNPQRLMRALEVKMATGSSIRQFQKKRTAERTFDIIRFGIDIPKEQLHNNINTRVDHMMRQGLLEEVTSLLPFRHLNALQTVGYSELFDHLEGTLSLDEAVQRIKINTRQYAKRQMTWFKKDPAIKWMTREDLLSFSPV